MKKTVLMVITLIITLMTVSSCGLVKFPIRFMVDGNVYGTISTTGNEKLTMPDNPQKEGYIFDGWYWDEGTWERPFTANSLLNEPISAEMEVYAKWIPIDGSGDYIPDEDDENGGKHPGNSDDNEGNEELKPGEGNKPNPEPAPEPENKNPTFIISSANAAAGAQSVEITVALKNNPGVTSMLIKIAFDDTALELVSMTYNTALGGATIPNASTKSPVTAYWADNFNNVTDDLVFVTLRFNVSRTATAGDYDVTIAYDENDVFNVNEENVKFDVSCGKITIL